MCIFIQQKNPMSFGQYLKESSFQIESELQNYTKIRGQENINKYPITDELINAFIDSCEGGKRLRAVLVKLGYEIANGDPKKNIYIPAIGVEIFQTAILAHDDIIDKSDMRRGKPTLYKALGGDHYGISQTICLGDIGLLLATKTMIDGDFDDYTKIRASHHFINMIINTGIGEMIDIKLPIMQNPSYEDIISVYKLKTAEYTINTPLKLGALFAGRDDKKLEVFNNFAINLGIAFQIKDDILGIFSDSKTIGKSIDSDIIEGKKTLLRLRAHNHMDSQQKKIRSDIYGHENINEDNIITIRNCLKDCGAYEYAVSEMQKYTQLAKQSINNITNNPMYIGLLDSFADLMIDRNK